MVGFGRDLKSHLTQPWEGGRDIPTVPAALGTARDGAAPAPLGIPAHSLPTLSGRDSSLISLFSKFLLFQGQPFTADGDIFSNIFTRVVVERQGFHLEQGDCGIEAQQFTLGQGDCRIEAQQIQVGILRLWNRNSTISGLNSEILGWKLNNFRFGQ